MNNLISRKQTINSKQTKPNAFVVPHEVLNQMLCVVDALESRNGLHPGLVDRGVPALRKELWKIWTTQKKEVE